MRPRSPLDWWSRLNTRTRRLPQRRRSRRQFEALEDRRLLATVPPGFTGTLITDNLSGPSAMEISPTGELWVVQQTGAARLVRPDGTVHTAATLTVDSFVERGLLGIAFDPLYDGAGPNTDYIYLYYTTPRTSSADPANNRLSRFTVAGAGTTTPTLGSELILRDLPPEDEDNNPATNGDANHNGGAVHVGVDGMLYVAVGDHNYDTIGQAGHVAQILTTPFGKILRLNRDGTNPTDNPFYNNDPLDWQGAIWALGLRNPYTFAIEPGTNRIFINDVGEGTWEEINLGEPAANYGWAGSNAPVWEGFENPPPPWANYRNPRMAYDHSNSTPPTPGAQAIAGGAFYPANSQFGSVYAGKYFFSDPYGGFIRIFDPAVPGSVSTPDTSVAFAGNNSTDAPVDLKVDSSGNLYYLDIFNGELWQISLTDGPRVIDDSEPGFNMTQGWLAGSGVGRDVDFKAALEQPGVNETATWTFTVTPGQYRVSATWASNPTYWATAAPFSVLDGGATRGTTLLNQRQAPNDFTYAGSPWEDIGVFDITGTTLTVRLSSDDANGYVAADAIRIERVGPPATGPEIQVTQGGFDVPDNTGVVAFGAVGMNESVEKGFTIFNVGSQTLQLGSPSVPPGFTLTLAPAQVLNPGESTGFRVRFNAVAPGAYSGQISFDTSDANENPFNFNVTASVLPVAILDDGQPGYAHDGLFASSQISLGRDGDVSYAVGGPALPSQASWTFNVSPGQYRIAATWFVNPTYWATNAPFTILDGATPLATVAINQRQEPNDLNESGSNWEFIGNTFNIAGSTLTVRLSNVGADGYVIADAIRIERVGDLNPLSLAAGLLPPGNSDLADDESQSDSSAELLATAFIDQGLDELAADVAAATARQTTTELADDVATSGPSDHARAEAIDLTLTELPE